MAYYFPIVDSLRYEARWPVRERLSLFEAYFVLGYGSGIVRDLAFLGRQDRGSRKEWRLGGPETTQGINHCVPKYRSQSVRKIGGF